MRLKYQLFIGKPKDSTEPNFAICRKLALETLDPSQIALMTTLQFSYLEILREP